MGAGQAGSHHGAAPGWLWVTGTGQLRLGGPQGVTEGSWGAQDWGAAEL